MPSLRAAFGRLVSVVSLVSVASFRWLSSVVSSVSRYPEYAFPSPGIHEFRMVQRRRLLT